MALWVDYMAGKSSDDGHTVTGVLKALPDVYSPQLNNHRTLLVHLPPSYNGGEKRYPVLYMHDGQNLFDAATSYAGEWQVDETMAALAAEGVEAIVVGIPNTGMDRVHEYSPFRQKGESDGRGRLYIDFVADTVKPLIDADFRTLPEREMTGLAGSSMGGLISLFGLFYRPEVFGLVGALSPAFEFGRMGIFPYIEQSEFVPGKIYLDVGTDEGRTMISNPVNVEPFSREYLRQVREMKYRLCNKGYQNGDSLLYIEDEGATHEEAAWVRRLPDALRFLLGE